ncbi:tyrosine-type recombinase/integrase [Natrialbaceae archaeon GCM10025810]|uniref:tyrosine-type recombinase/integrase n=1 Tax=Halovalidus salilacus TaxID=3075124 RepID=UPI00360DF413
MAEVVIADAVDAYLERKAVGDPTGSGAGAYASNAESILTRWAAWLERERDLTSLFALDADHMRSYAAELRDRTERGEYTASTANTYYAVVRAFLSWCVDGGILESNPAATDRSEAALPSTDRGSSGGRPDDANDGGDDRFWTDDRRRALEAYVRDRAETANGDGARLRRLREYTMVSLLAHSDARGAELFRVPEDDRRTGATWDDVDFYTGTVRVLGKSQRLEDVPLPAPARTPLRRYRVVLDPPSNDWPLFPTRHAPSIAKRVRAALADRGHDEDEIAALFDDATATRLAREHDIAPPAITTEGARSILKRLCEEAGVDVDGDYLTPRGVRHDRGETRRQSRRDAPGARTSLRASVERRELAVVEERPTALDVERDVVDLDVDVEAGADEARSDADE